MGSDKRGHKKRKRRSSDSSTEEDDAGLSNWKLGMVVAVVVICFAMLYPTVFHPLLMSFFGGRQEQPKPTQQRPPMHPGMGSRPGPRSDVHPAMRMAQSQAETTQAQGGGRGGMSTWMLPVYTVGVVVFLLYTLFKSKNKKKKRSRYDIDSSEEEEELMGYKRGRHSGDKKKKMQGLQERLRQTEEAMARILEQLEKVQAEGLSLADSADNQQEQEAGKVEEVDDDEDTQNADVDAEEEQQPSTSKPANPEIEDADPLKTKQGERYLSDLEQALADFKVLSDEYDAVKHGKKDRRRSHSSSSESASETSDSEKMSSPDSEESESEEEEKISERKPKKKHAKEYVDNSVKESVIPKKKEAEAKTRRRVRRE